LIFHLLGILQLPLQLLTVNCHVACSGLGSYKFCTQSRKTIDKLLAVTLLLLLIFYLLGIL